RIIQQGDIYGYGLHEKLGTLGFGNIPEGTIYPLLLKLQKISSSLASAVLPAMAPIANIITSLMPVKTLWLTFSNSGNNLPKQWHSLTKEVPNHEKFKSAANGK
ncbi:transcriptional regulator PadR family protein, partial [Lacticaseibacillus rhamnosus MTCC 5462]